VDVQVDEAWLHEGVQAAPAGSLLAEIPADDASGTCRNRSAQRLARGAAAHRVARRGTRRTARGSAERASECGLAAVSGERGDCDHAGTESDGE
jgi:hypothetical protein